MSVEILGERLSQCISQYLVQGVPGPTLERVIEMTLHKERYAGEFAPIVLDNDVYSQLVLRVDFLQSRIKEWIAEMPEGQSNTRVILERIFTLLGKQASRNLIASIRVARIGGQLPRKKNERFIPNPKEQLKHALTCEEFCNDRNYASADIAFLAGLQYDLLWTSLIRGKASREVQNAFPILFADSLKIAHFAYELGSRMGSFPKSECAFAGGLSLGLGKILATALYPKEGKISYAGFLAELEKKTILKWEFKELEERTRFPVLPVELASIASLSFGFFNSIEPAIRYSSEAYFLKLIKPELHPLSFLLGVAEVLAAGRPLSADLLSAMKYMGLSTSVVAEAKQAVSSKGGRG